MAYTPVPAGAASVGGGSSIGSPITGTGGNNRVLGIDGSGNLKDFPDLTFNETTNDLTVVDSESGGSVVAQVSNTSNTASSHSEIKATVAGTSGGNPGYLLEITGGRTHRLFADNADLDLVKLVSGTSYPAAGAGEFVWQTNGSSIGIPLYGVGRKPQDTRQGSNYPLLQAYATPGSGDYVTISANAGGSVAGAGFSCEGSAKQLKIIMWSVSSPAGTAPRALTNTLQMSADTTMQYYTTGANEMVWGTNATERMSLDTAGNVLIGTAAVATTATDGFLYVTSCAGTPTGVPTAKTGRVPIVIDSTNNKLYFYSGAAWRDAGP